MIINQFMFQIKDCIFYFINIIIDIIYWIENIRKTVAFFFGLFFLESLQIDVGIWLLF